MKLLQMTSGLMLSCCLISGLCSCKTSAKLSDISRVYAEQSSVKCTVQYNVRFDAVIDGVAYSNLEHNGVFDAQVDLTSGNCWILGEMTSLLDGVSLGRIEVESYGSSDGSYYRYDNFYCFDTEENAFLTFIQAPLTLNLSEGYTALETSQILYGSTCTVYSGTEIADDTPQRWIDSSTSTTFSLEGCLIQVTAFIYDSSGLPACIKLDYSNLEDMAVTFSDEAGNSYTITALNYEVLYNSYGAAVSTDVPEEFLQAVSDTQEAADSSEDSTSADQETLPSNGSNDEGIYDLSNAQNTYCYEITTPEYMALNEQEENCVSFYYLYAEHDYEVISYTLCEGCTSQEEQDYAESLPDFYRASDGIGDVSSSGVQTITVGDYSISYSKVTMTVAYDGRSYELLDICSWTEAPNGQDCLEVCITEYNASGDGIMIDVESELEYAYGAVTLYQQG